MSIYNFNDRVIISQYEFRELKKNKNLVNKVHYVAIPQRNGSSYNGYRYYKLKDLNNISQLK